MRTAAAFGLGQSESVRPGQKGLMRSREIE
jgi:hypothetical protein